jgi:hypothetical protein
MRQRLRCECRFVAFSGPSSRRDQTLALNLRVLEFVMSLVFHVPRESEMAPSRTGRSHPGRFHVEPLPTALRQSGVQ